MRMSHTFESMISNVSRFSVCVIFFHRTSHVG